MRLDSDQEYMIRTLIEDSVEHLCEQEMLSGELVWTTVAALAEAKRQEYKGIFPFHQYEMDAWLRDDIFDR